MFIDNNNRILCQDFELATPVKSASLLTGGPGETKDNAWFHWIKIERGRLTHTDKKAQRNIRIQE
jgi:hypothetical protein